MFFHAHPDDESIASGGSIAKYAAEGHTVIVVSATEGENGEVAEGFLRRNETLAERRRAELLSATRVLGAHETLFLGYTDSGMMGTPENEAPGSFWSAGVDEAARRLAQILTERDADILTVDDANGTYGHPDHIQVHRVGVRAAELAGTPHVFEHVVDRDRVQKLAERVAEAGIEGPAGDDMAELGVPGELVTHDIDVGDYLGLKRSAMAAHASQITETSFFLSLPPDLFVEVWGTESFVLRGAEPSRPTKTSLVD